MNEIEKLKPLPVPYETYRHAPGTLLARSPTNEARESVDSRSDGRLDVDTWWRLGDVNTAGTGTCTYGIRSSPKWELQPLILLKATTQAEFFEDSAREGRGPAVRST